MEMYIIGDRNVPFWCKRRLMPYMKMKGETGFEFHGKQGILLLEKGDRLLRGHNKEIFVRKKG